MSSTWAMIESGLSRRSIIAAPLARFASGSESTSMIEMCSSLKPTDGRRALQVVVVAVMVMIVGAVANDFLPRPERKRLPNLRSLTKGAITESVPPRRRRGHSRPSLLIVGWTQRQYSPSQVNYKAAAAATSATVTASRPASTALRSPGCCSE